MIIIHLLCSLRPLYTTLYDVCFLHVLVCILQMVGDSDDSDIADDSDVSYHVSDDSDIADDSDVSDVSDISDDWISDTTSSV